MNTEIPSGAAFILPYTCCCSKLAPVCLPHDDDCFPGPSILAMSAALSAQHRPNDCILLRLLGLDGQTNDENGKNIYCHCLLILVASLFVRGFTVTTHSFQKTSRALLFLVDITETSGELGRGNIVSAVFLKGPRLIYCHSGDYRM